MTAHTRRTFLRHAGCVAAAAVPMARVFAAGRSTTIRTGGAFDLSVLLGRGHENVLKLFRAAVDPDRERLYVSGILTRPLAIVDTSQKTVVGTIDSGIDGNALKYLVCAPLLRRLYLRDATNHTLTAIDLDSGRSEARVSVPAQTGSMLVDERRRIVYLLTAEAPGVRLLDAATLETVGGVDALGTGLAQGAIDAASGTLYLLDASDFSSIGRIHSFHPNRGIGESIEFAQGRRSRHLVWDPLQERFIVSVPGQAVLIVGARGGTQDVLPVPSGLDLEDVACDARRGRVLALFVERPSEGRVAGVGAHLFQYDGRRWEPWLSFGRKVHSICLDDVTGEAYCPAGDESTVWHAGPDASTVSALRIGDSVEQVLPALGGGQLLLNSRLGGSYLAACDAETGTVETFTAGTWPIPLRTDDRGERLFVLNAWDSTVSVFRLQPPRALERTIDIGLPAGTTDRLPDMAVGTASGLAYLAYPEFGKVAVIDWRAGTALDAIVIDAFPAGDVGGGPGQLQVALDESRSRLFVYQPSQRRIDVYDVRRGATHIDRVALPPLGSSVLGWVRLFVDAERGRVFAGSSELDAATGRPAGGQIAAGTRVFAVDGDAYWSAGMESSRIVVARLDRNTLGRLDAFDVGPASTIAPDFAFDGRRGRLYVGHLPAARVDVYSVE